MAVTGTWNVIIRRLDESTCGLFGGTRTGPHEGEILGHVRNGTLIKAEDKPKATGLGAGRSKP